MFLKRPSSPERAGPLQRAWQALDGPIGACSCSANYSAFFVGMLLHNTNKNMFLDSEILVDDGTHL